MQVQVRFHLNTENLNTENSSPMPTREYNFDGLIGPTHNYAGLSFGNVASAAHQNQASSPRAAALQGLEKMKFVASLGIGQCVLPPLRRPRFEFLRELGFSGTDNELIDKAFKHSPVLLASCFSASSMWTANAATVSPSVDCADGRLHLTPANLSSTLHRSIEHPSTTRNLRAIFNDEKHFVVHEPLASQPGMSDEGAANHTRLTPEHGESGLELFAYGVDSMNRDSPKPAKFPARQTLLASQAIARNHGLAPSQRVFMHQNPAAIDAGVFHNDVISVGNENVLLCHSLAFVDQQKQLSTLKELFEIKFDSLLDVIEFSADELPIADAVSSYLFNSQILTRPDGSMVLVCPLECKENANAFGCTQKIAEGSNRIDEVVFLDLRQSMNNGGGPACLRLRVVMDESQQKAMHQGVLFTDGLHDELVAWVEKHYREQLTPEDLRDPNLVAESFEAIEALADILKLPAEVLLDQKPNSA